MADYTDETAPGCERDAVFAVDVLDVDRRLLSEHISVDETLNDCGFGPQKCSYLEIWVNKRRQRDGRDPLKKGTITPATTIRKVIEYVCA